MLHGGIRREDANGGKLDQFVNVDGDKAGLWKGFFVTMHAESRYGNSVIFDAAGLAPVNANMLYPLPRQEVTSITGLLFTQALSEEWLVSVGKFNMLDLFNQMYPQTGRGITGFPVVTSEACKPGALNQQWRLNVTKDLQLRLNGFAAKHNLAGNGTGVLMALFNGRPEMKWHTHPA